MKQICRILTGVGLLAVLMFASCNPRDSAKLPAAEAREAIHAVGYLEPRGKLRRLAFQSHGVIQEIRVGIGDHVKTGDIIAQLDDSVEKSSLGMAKSKLALAEANRNLVLAGAHPDDITIAEKVLLTAGEEMKYREQEKRRMLAMSDHRGVSAFERDASIYQSNISESKCCEAEATLRRLKNQVREEDRVVLDAQVAIAQAEVIAAQEVLNQKVMKAPVGGVIAEVFMEAGEAISPSVSEPIVLLSPAGPVDVRVEVDERFSDRVKVGWVANVNPANSMPSIPGRIRMIKEVMGRKTVFSRDATERMDLQVLEVWVEVSQPLELPIGAEVKVEIVAGEFVISKGTTMESKK